MALIHEERGIADRTPAKSDTTAMASFANSAKNSGDQLQQQLDYEDKQEEAEQQDVSLRIENAGMAIYKGALELYPSDPENYAKTVGESLQKLYSELPDTPATVTSMAKVQLAGASSVSKVQSNARKKKEKLRVAVRKENTFSKIEAKKSLIGSYIGMDKTASPKEVAMAKEAVEVANGFLLEAARSRFEQDANGNFLYTAPERAVLLDSWVNKDYYAIIDFAGDNIEDNRAGVVELRDNLANNKAKYMEKYSLEEKEYQKAITDVDKIISNQTTDKDLREIRLIQMSNRSMIEEADIRVDGAVGGKNYNNLPALIALRTTLADGAKRGAYSSTSERKDLADLQAKVSLAIVAKIDKDLGFKETTEELEVGNGTKVKRKNRRNPRNPTVGQTAVIETYNHLEVLANGMTYRRLSDGQKSIIKADMLVETYGGLVEAEDVDIDGKGDSKQTLFAKQIATGTYHRQIEALIGYVPIVKNNNSPIDIERAYRRAYFAYDNQQTYRLAKDQLNGTK